MTLTLLVLQFAVCAALIGRAGYMLCRSADHLARHHGWGRGWVGLAMLSTVTSLPELASGVSAVAWVDAPNLAVGDVLGSCVFNLVFLVVVDGLRRQQPMYRLASASHLLTAAFGVVMLGFVAMSLLLAAEAPRLFHVGLYSPLILALYALALTSVNKHERAGMTQAAPSGEPVDAAAEWRQFGLATAVVLVAGAWLPEVADRLAQATGLSRSFVGTLWLAFATSVPEIAVTLSALRLGALDLAISNLLGSNLFNMVVLAVDDAVYLRGPLLADVSPVHAGTAVAAIVMTGLVMIGLVIRPQGRVLRVLSWISVGLLATYVLNAALV
ncbi:MAG TPA: sodium:calcium antiporter, partial [Rubrivivax sp.]|nr:sodium:calcium antiporter [Rubrivivax sp.]